MPGWLVRVVTKRFGSDEKAVPMVETYIASVADRMAAWGAVATIVNKMDPLATVDVVGEASEDLIVGQQVPDGEVKL